MQDTQTKLDGYPPGESGELEANDKPAEPIHVIWERLAKQLRMQYLKGGTVVEAPINPPACGRRDRGNEWPSGLAPGPDAEGRHMFDYLRGLPDEGRESGAGRAAAAFELIGLERLDDWSIPQRYVQISDADLVEFRILGSRAAVRRIGAEFLRGETPALVDGGMVRLQIISFRENYVVSSRKADMVVFAQILML